MCAQLLSRGQPFTTLWTVVCQAPLSMGFSRQKYLSGLPFPPPEDLPNPEIEPASLAFPSLAGGSFTTSVTWEAHQLKLDSSKTIHLPIYWSQLSLLLIESIHVPLLIHLHPLSLLWAPGGRTSFFIFCLYIYSISSLSTVSRTEMSIPFLFFSQLLFNASFNYKET